MNSENNIKERVYQFITENTFSDPSNIEYDTLIFKEGFFDSMGFITLITFLENEFNVKTEDKDFIEENFESINAIFDYVARKLTINA
ncbi:MAG: acyl carrier protein [Bacteroidales bacterium]